MPTAGRARSTSCCTADTPSPRRVTSPPASTAVRAVESYATGRRTRSEAAAFDVAVVEPDAIPHGSRSSSPGARSSRRSRSWCQRLDPSRPVVAVFGPGFVSPFGLPARAPRHQVHPELGAVFAVEGSRPTCSSRRCAPVRVAQVVIGGEPASTSRSTGSASSSPVRRPADGGRHPGHGRARARAGSSSVFSTKGGVGKTTSRSTSRRDGEALRRAGGAHRRRPAVRRRVGDARPSAAAHRARRRGRGAVRRPRAGAALVTRHHHRSPGAAGADRADADRRVLPGEMVNICAAPGDQRPRGRRPADECSTTRARAHRGGRRRAARRQHGHPEHQEPEDRDADARPRGHRGPKLRLVLNRRTQGEARRQGDRARARSEAPTSASRRPRGADLGERRACPWCSTTRSPGPRPGAHGEALLGSSGSGKGREEGPSQSKSAIEDGRP